VLPPSAAKAAPTPPTLAEVLRALPSVRRGVPYVLEESRDDIDMKAELLVDQTDEPCYFPLVGRARLRHVHWKCTVYYTETLTSDYPFPFQGQRRRSEVVYIDKDCLIQAAVSAGGKP
jgi:hypothetical protein